MNSDYLGTTVGIQFKKDSLSNPGGDAEAALPIQHQRNWSRRDMETDGVRMVGDSGHVKWHFLFEVLGSEGDSILLAPYFSKTVLL